MTCSQCDGIEREFDTGFAEKELKRYRRKGPRKTTRLLIAALQAHGLEGMTLLDIGGGVGALQIGLVSAGARGATGVDASSALLAAAREEAGKRGLADRIEHMYGDFVDVVESLSTYDIITLDRVICCYHDMPKLVGLSAERCRRFYALVYPRDTWWMRTGVTLTNGWFRMRKSPMRTFVHPTWHVDAEVRRRGFDLDIRRQGLFWQTVVYRRTHLSSAA